MTLPPSIHNSPSSVTSSPFNYAFPGHKLKSTIYESPLKKTFKSPPAPLNREVVSAGPAYSTNLGNVSYRVDQPSTSQQQQHEATASPANRTQVMVGAQVAVTSTSPMKSGKGAEGGMLPKVAKNAQASSAASLIASLVLDAKGIASSRYQQLQKGSKAFGSPGLSKNGNYFSGPGGFKVRDKSFLCNHNCSQLSTSLLDPSFLPGLPLVSQLSLPSWLPPLVLKCTRSEERVPFCLHLLSSLQAS